MDTTNYGNISIATGLYENNLIAYYDTLDRFYGYTYCDFTSYVSDKSCKDCPTNEYSLTPNSTGCMSCNDIKTLTGYD